MSLNDDGFAVDKLCELLMPVQLRRKKKTPMRMMQVVFAIF